MKKSRIQYKIYRRAIYDVDLFPYYPIPGQRYYDVYIIMGNGNHTLLKNYRNRKDRAINFINKLKKAKV